MIKILMLMKQKSPVEKLEEIIIKRGDYVKLYKTSDAFEGMKILKINKISLIILDTSVAENETDGIRIAEGIRKIKGYSCTKMIIFSRLVDESLYSYNHLHCFKFYELPFDMKEAGKLINDIMDYETERDIAEKERMVFIRKGSSFYSIQTSEIIMIRCYSRYLELVTRQKNWEIDIRQRKSIFEVIDEENYPKINRNEFVNVKYVSRIDEDDNSISLRESSEKVYISKRGKRKILSLIDIINLNNRD